jgi:hypothetical protein
MAVRVVNS